MSSKKFIMSIAVGMLRCAYVPMKLMRSENRITIISRQSDEPTQDVALLSDYIRQNHPDVECRVMCRKMEGANLLSYGVHMLSQMISMAKSKVLVLDGYCVGASVLKHKPDLKIVQMWHSMAAIKKFGYQAVGTKEGRSEALAKALHMHRNYDYVIAPSEITGKYFCEAFDTDERKLKLMGLPRVDVIKNNINLGSNDAENSSDLSCKTDENFERRVRGEYGVSDEQEIILYVPTFRKSAEVDVQSVIDALDSEKYKLIIKLHPLYDRAGISDSKYSTYEWLRVCDRIITDYSALGVEATLVDKPVYFYVYDLDNYSENLGLNVNPVEEMPKASARTASELKELISQEYDFDELEKFKKKYISINTDNCTAQLGDYLYGIVKEMA